MAVNPEEQMEPPPACNNFGDYRFPSELLVHILSFLGQRGHSPPMLDNDLVANCTRVSKPWYMAAKEALTIFHTYTSGNWSQDWSEKQLIAFRASWPSLRKAHCRLSGFTTLGKVGLPLTELAGLKCSAWKTFDVSSV